MDSLGFGWGGFGMMDGEVWGRWRIHVCYSLMAGFIVWVEGDTHAEYRMLSKSFTTLTSYPVGTYKRLPTTFHFEYPK